MEEQVVFNAFSDKKSLVVSNEDGNKPIVEITGYDLSVEFNMSEIHSIDDAEDACEALARVFFKSMFEQLLVERNNT